MRTLNETVAALIVDYGLGNVIASLSDAVHAAFHENGGADLGPQWENYAKADPALGRLALAMDTDI